MLCLDCTYYVANNEPPTVLAYCAEWRERVENTEPPTPQGWWGVGSDDAEPFSSAPCGMCGTTITGERYPAEWVPTGIDGASLADLPAALAAATDAEVLAYYTRRTGESIEANTFGTDPYRLAARDENRKREQAAFLALSPHERTPDAYRN